MVVHEINLEKEECIRKKARILRQRHAEIITKVRPKCIMELLRFIIILNIHSLYFCNLKIFH